MRSARFRDAGRYVYGLAGVLMGLIGLRWQDFGAVWQPLENLGADGPHRQAIACVFAAALLLAGLASWVQKTAHLGLITLALLHTVSLLGWIPRIAANPGVFGLWNGLFEQLALVSAGVVAYAYLSSMSYEAKARAILIGRIVFGLCAISFAFGHFTAIAETADFVPKWIPLGGVFWAWATGVFHLLAGVAILSSLQAVLASRAYVAMMLGFGLLVWLPLLVSKPETHFIWAGNAVNLALLGAAWIIADSITRERASSSSWRNGGP